MRPTFFIQSTAEEHQGRFSVLSVLDSTVMINKRWNQWTNMDMQIFLPHFDRSLWEHARHMILFMWGTTAFCPVWQLCNTSLSTIYKRSDWWHAAITPLYSTYLLMKASFPEPHVFLFHDGFQDRSSTIKLWFLFFDNFTQILFIFSYALSPAFRALYLFLLILQSDFILACFSLVS